MNRRGGSRGAGFGLADSAPARRPVPPGPGSVETMGGARDASWARDRGVGDLVLGHERTPRCLSHQKSRQTEPFGHLRLT